MDSIMRIFTKSTCFSFIPNLFKNFALSVILSRAGFYKTKGLKLVTLFVEAISSIITAKTTYAYIRHGKTAEAESLFKSPFYRFLNNSSANWRSLQLQIANRAITQTAKLTKSNKKKCFVIDDSTISRNRSKSVELMAKVYNHVDHVFQKGFTYLALLWTDGYTNIPIDFALMSSSNDKYCINKTQSIDNRKASDKRKTEARKNKPKVVVELLNRALNAGLEADLVLFDTWFTTAPMLKEIRNLGLHVIGMLKHMNNSCYIYKGRKHTLKSLKEHLERTGVFKRQRNGVIGSVIVTTCGSKKNPVTVKVKLVFVCHRHIKDKVITLACTDLSLNDTEIIKQYSNRWKIEELFHTEKHLLGLITGSMARNYNAIIAHFTLVNLAYIFLEYQRRYENDVKTMGEIFEDAVEEICDIPFDIALNKLLSLIYDIIDKLHANNIIKSDADLKLAKDIADGMITEWYNGLPEFLSKRYGLQSA